MVGLNLCLILIVVFNGTSAMIKPPGKQLQKGPSDFIIRTLKLNDAQAAAFYKLRDQHRDSMRVLHEEGRELRHRYFERLKEDQQQDNDLLKKITQNQAQIESITFRHFQSVRGLCSNEQLGLFDQNIFEVLRQMSQHHP